MKEQNSEHRAENLDSPSPISHPPSPKIKYKSLEEAKSAAMVCKKCALCNGRTNVVFSDGNEKSKIMFPIFAFPLSIFYSLTFIAIIRFVPAIGK